jgi:hypothetical protein
MGGTLFRKARRYDDFRGHMCGRPYGNQLPTHRLLPICHRKSPYPTHGESARRVFLSESQHLGDEKYSGGTKIAQGATIDRISNAIGAG